MQNERGGAQALPAFDYSKVHLYIATPSRGQCTMNFATSMAKSCMMLVAAGCNVSWVMGTNDCFVDWSRNKMIADFMESNCTHIWFCDDDMGWNIDAPLRMLAKDKDFIAGAGPKKQEPPEFAVKNYTNRHYSLEGDKRPYVRDGLIGCSHIGGAFVMLKRVVAERMFSAYPYLKCAQLHPEFGYSLFQSEYTRKDWRGEDYTFCERWTYIGGEIWCYPDIDFTHAGQKEWAGNYHKFLLNPGAQRPEPVTAASVYVDSLIEKLRAMAPIPPQIQEVLR